MSKRSIRHILKKIKFDSNLNVKDNKFIDKSLKDIKVIDYLLNCLDNYEK